MDRKALLQYSVRVAWSEEDAAFIAQSPEFRGITAFGASYGEAVTELEQALQLAVETHEEEGWPVPTPVYEHRFSGQFRLRLPRSLHGWLSARAHEEGVSLNALVAGYLAQARGFSDKGGDKAERRNTVELLG
jgi:predicted RNase H-like HicB family nuclease